MGTQMGTQAASWCVVAHLDEAAEHEAAEAVGVEDGLEREEVEE